MQIRILSDLHIDQNPKFELKNKSIFTIIAGDISKDTSITSQWIGNNLEQGLFIEGNHAFTNNGPCIQQVYSTLSQEFPITNNVTFLQNSYKEINNKIFVGATLWTDFKLGNFYTFTKEFSPYRPLDSYIRGNIQEQGLIRKLTVQDTISEFHKSITYIDYTCRKFQDKDIIVITHHCPSMLCSSLRFKNNTLNPALISYLEPFIKKHNNIKYWICGHCHRDPLNTKLEQCTLLMNPRGYTKFNECPNFDENFCIEI